MKINVALPATPSRLSDRSEPCFAVFGTLPSNTYIRLAYTWEEALVAARELVRLSEGDAYAIVEIKAILSYRWQV